MSRWIAVALALLCSAVSFDATKVLIQSNFLLDTEGWTSLSTTSSATAPSIAHNPLRKLIEASDSDAQVWYFVAPPSCLGNRVKAYGGTLGFTLGHSSYQSLGLAYLSSDYDIILESSTQKLSIGLKSVFVPWQMSQKYTLTLDETAGWTHTTTGSKVLPYEFSSLMTSLSALKIRGSYYEGSETTTLNDVFMLAAAASFSVPPEDAVSRYLPTQNLQPRTCDTGCHTTVECIAQFSNNRNPTVWLKSTSATRLPTEVEPVRIEFPDVPAPVCSTSTLRVQMQGLMPLNVNGEVLLYGEDKKLLATMFHGPIEFADRANRLQTYEDAVVLSVADTMATTADGYARFSLVFTDKEQYFRATVTQVSLSWNPVACATHYHAYEDVVVAAVPYDSTSSTTYAFPVPASVASDAVLTYDIVTSTVQPFEEKIEPITVKEVSKTAEVPSLYTAFDAAHITGTWVTSSVVVPRDVLTAGVQADGTVSFTFTSGMSHRMAKVRLTYQPTDCYVSTLHAAKLSHEQFLDFSFTGFKTPLAAGLLTVTALYKHHNPAAVTGTDDFTDQIQVYFPGNVLQARLFTTQRGDLTTPFSDAIVVPLNSLKAWHREGSASIRLTLPSSKYAQVESITLTYP